MSIGDLTQRIASGERLKYVFFWGHTSRGPEVGASCMSQWHPTGFEVEGIQYATAEHYMMAEKARLFGDREMLEQILASAHPGAAKKLGRKVRGFDDARWKQHRFDIVCEGNYAKFGQHEGLKQYLLNTGERILVEASPHDRIWGIGMKKDDPRAEHPDQWRGLNLLGFALMEVRAALAQEEG